jgi:hypothetical protein
MYLNCFVLLHSITKMSTNLSSYALLQQLLLLVLLLLPSTQADTCTRDPTNTDLAPIPSTDMTSNTMPSPDTLAMNHQYEFALIQNYRPQSLSDELVEDPPRTNCPYNDPAVVDFHDSSIWPGNVVPGNLATVTIPDNTKVLVSSCSIPSGVIFTSVTVPSTSSLIFTDATIDFHAQAMTVQGSLLIGSETCRMRSNSISITLHGTRPPVASVYPTAPPASTKGIYVNNGQIEIHGAYYFPTWTRLAKTALPGDTFILIQDEVNWQPGQQIVITTSQHKDSRDFTQNEQFTIVAVRQTGIDGINEIELSSPLQYRHVGEKLLYQSEVGLLSRNIIIQGDFTDSEPTDTANAVCQDANTGSTYPCENKYLTGYGGHVLVTGTSAIGHFRGVEFKNVGQTNVLGRYPVHFHLMEDAATGANPSNNVHLPQTRAYAIGCSVVYSYFRAYAIHGTDHAVVQENTAFDIIGHCYFIEDGVEEDNTIMYNMGAYIHALSNYAADGNSNWWSQQLGEHIQTSSLILPSDVAASVYYITNPHNIVQGNAGSGGWACVSVPTLLRPVKLHAYIDNFNPSTRTFALPLAGNTCHSTGFWWSSAAAYYIGGQLWHETAGDSNSLLHYTAGRSAAHDTCADNTVNTPNGDGGCWSLSDQRWLELESNVAWMANRGLQNWGDRSFNNRLEFHDVGLSMNVFGSVGISNMLMECRSTENSPQWMNGCLNAGSETTDPAWGICSVRDYYYWTGFTGFQFYDVGQSHILVNVIFRNCNGPQWGKCIYQDTPGVCSSDTAVFMALSHSDQFVPQEMQTSQGIVFENVGLIWTFSTSLSDPGGVTTSGRNQGWRDHDGSASRLGVDSLMGSSWAKKWWFLNNNCILEGVYYKCPVSPGDSVASVFMEYNPTTQGNIGDTICVNGRWDVSDTRDCPVIAQVAHFGRLLSDGFDVSVDARITGPIIQQSGGWYIRFTNGVTPKVISFREVQIRETDVMIIAIPYPVGTTFTIRAIGASWCAPADPYSNCYRIFDKVNTLAEVRSGFGDKYFVNANGVLFFRLVQKGSTFGGNTDNVPWTDVPTTDKFVFGGLSLVYPVWGDFSQWDYKVTITASCNPCTLTSSSLTTPAALGGSVSPTTTKPTVEPTFKPSKLPSAKPSFKPSLKPTVKPTLKPSVKPTFKPTLKPSVKPTFKPSKLPTIKPTKPPSKIPSKFPSRKPTVAPSRKPTKVPSRLPSRLPSKRPVVVG